MDLRDNKIPFGLLTEEEQEHLRHWPHGVEKFEPFGWEDCPNPGYLRAYTYRTKPAPKPAPLTQVLWANDYANDNGPGEWVPKS